MIIDFKPIQITFFTLINYELMLIMDIMWRRLKFNLRGIKVFKSPRANNMQNVHLKLFLSLDTPRNLYDKISIIF